MKKIIILLVIYLILSAAYASCQDIFIDEYEQANDLYNQKQYDQALRKYESIFHKGCYSFNLFFNIGNAYYLKGDIGRALLFYKRAEIMDASDSDLKVNMDLVKAKMKRSDVSMNTYFLKNMITQYINEVSFKSLIASIIVFYILILLMFIFRRRLAKLGIIFNFLIIFCAATLCVNVYALVSKTVKFNNSGVIVEKILDVKLEPESSSQNVIILYEGMEVYILRKENNWYKIRTKKQDIGWIESSSFDFLKF
jgi:tetratricopeptide (TPR) repeat protein